MLDACNAIAFTRCINIGRRPSQYVGWKKREVVLTLGCLHKLAESLDLTLCIKLKVVSR